MKTLMLKTGNFFFKWRDLSFSLVFLASFFVIAYLPEWGVGKSLFREEQGFQIEILASVLGLLFAMAGQVVRAITIGLAYIKRGGLNKKIYAESLVQRGMFAHSRNPLYLGNLLILTGVIFSVNIHFYYLLVLPVFYFIYFSITYAEEVFLRGKFGKEYDEYCKAVPNRYFPGQLSKWKESRAGMTFTWKRLLKKEHGSFFVIFVSLALVNLLKFHSRFNISFSSEFAYTLYVFIGVLAVFQIVCEILKRTGRLEWDPDRP